MVIFKRENGGGGHSHSSKSDRKDAASKTLSSYNDDKASFKKDCKDESKSRDEKKIQQGTGTGNYGQWYPYCQFQSHDPEFDYLKSLEIEEKINQIRFTRSVGDHVFLLSTNDKTINLWKVGPSLDVYVPMAQESLARGGGLRLPRRMPRQPSTADCFDADAVVAVRRHSYQSAHAYHINSIDPNSDGETFLSADDLRVNWWNYEYPASCFNILDTKPSSMEELTEVITVARFHPSDCNMLLYGSSKGVIKVGDTRSAALLDRHAKILEDPEDATAKTFFSEIVSSISNINFSQCGRYLVSRDYLTVKIWDLHMDSRPIKVLNVHEHLRSVLCDLYESDCIFDKFESAFSPDGNSIVTGSYSNQFSVMRTDGSLTRQAVLPSSNNGAIPMSDGGKKLKDIKLGPGCKDTHVSPEQKILHCSWHPHDNTVAVAGGAALYFYDVV